MTTVLCMHHRPDDFRGLLEARFPGIQFAYAANNEEIVAQLAAMSPNVVFSIKGPEFPGNLHHKAVEAPSVKWVHVGGSGYDHMQPFDSEKIIVTNSAGVLARHLSETVTGAMLAMNGNFFSYHRQQQDAVWRNRPFRPLAGQTLLVVGLGKIGDWVARNAKALGMKVLAIRRTQKPTEHVDAMFAPEQLHQALQDADYVSLHVRANDDTHHMLNDEAFAAMKPGARLINTARGSVVDTNALIRSLECGQLAGAYLDVFEEEPLPADHPLWARDDVFMTPHAADSIEGWEHAFAEFFADNLARWINDEPLVNRVSG